MSQSECGRDYKLQDTLWIFLSLHTREQQSRYWGTAFHRPQFEIDTKNRILAQTECVVSRKEGFPAGLAQTLTC
jgi:hypothetical protein